MVWTSMVGFLGKMQRKHTSRWGQHMLHPKELTYHHESCPGSQPRGMWICFARAKYSTTAHMWALWASIGKVGKGFLGRRYLVYGSNSSSVIFTYVVTWWQRQAIETVEKHIFLLHMQSLDRCFKKRDAGVCEKNPMVHKSDVKQPSGKYILGSTVSMGISDSNLATYLPTNLSTYLFFIHLPIRTCVSL